MAGTAGTSDTQAFTQRQEICMNRLRHHLSQFYVIPDSERFSSPRLLNSILFILLLAIIPAGIYHILAGRIWVGILVEASALPVFAASWLSRRGHATMASFILMLSLLGMTISLLFYSDGLHDIAMLLYPPIILISSLLLKRRGYIVVVSIVLLSVIATFGGQWLGWVNTLGQPMQILVSDFWMALLILSVTALVIFLLTENMRHNIRQAQNNQRVANDANQKLQQEINERQHSEKVQQAIYRISEAAQTTPSLGELYIAIHHIVCQMMSARNFYIALYDPRTDLFSVPYLSDEFDHHWEPYHPGKGLSAYVLRHGKPMLVTPEVFAELQRNEQVEILNHPMVDWLGVPLRTRRGIIGVMAVQTYSPDERLTEADKDVLVFVSTQVATAIERKQAEEERQRLIAELEAKNAELERFTYTVSHDLKSPLITIRGFADYLQRDLETGNIERVRQDLNRITQSAEKMQELLQDLLELSRVGRMANPPDAISFGIVVEEALAAVQGILQAKKAEIGLQGEMPTIYGDRIRLVEVMQNLFENAIKFMGDQPAPYIQVGVQENTVNGMPVFYVRDNGMGIEAQFQEKIFGLFEKLDGSGEGTGIGLALVKRIIEVHGGTIWVESEGVGKGSTFYFTLPTAPNM
jgi:signal transduction histidine kinase